MRLPHNKDCLCETKGMLSPGNRFLCRSKHNQIATQQRLLVLDQGDAVPWQSVLMQKQAQSDCHTTRIACARPRGCCILAIDACAEVTQSDCHTTRIACARPRGCCSLTIDSCPEVSTIRLPCNKECLCETKGVLFPGNRF